MSRGVPAWVLAALLAAHAVACRDPRAVRTQSSAPSAGPSSSPPWDATTRAPRPPEGMVWIPPGALVAGSPPGILPRVADREMPAEQVMLGGFFVSIYPYPDEEGAIPLANVTQPEAQALCEERAQRLCTELEWERACKGPENHLYEYGDRHRPDLCGTGGEPRMLPSGLRVACRSDFGARDLHGSLWEWTASAWGRGTKDGLVALRGGNGSPGELIGRCANAEPRAPGQKNPTVGFRCCSGPPNEARVVLHVDRGPPLQPGSPEDQKLGPRLEALVPAEARLELGRAGVYRVRTVQRWHPIGNEELLVGSGCTGEFVGRRCGVVVARRGAVDPDVLAWAGSGVFPASLDVDVEPRFLWVYGGDERSHYRRLLTYAWGRVVSGEVERNTSSRRPATDHRRSP